MSANRVVQVLLDDEFGEEDIPAFVDTSLGFGAVMPDRTDKRTGGNKYRRFNRNFGFGKHCQHAQVFVDAYHYGETGVGRLTARYVAVQFLEGTKPEFDVDLTMTRDTIPHIVRALRKFIYSLEEIQKKITLHPFTVIGPNSVARFVKDEVEQLFERTVAELQPYSIFIKI